MISAAFIWEPGVYDAEFNALNAVVEAAAKASPGFLGVEEWVSEDGKRRNATYYWESMNGVNALASDPMHIEAKKKYTQWYNGYHVVISEVVRSYGDNGFSHITPKLREAA